MAKVDHQLTEGEWAIIRAVWEHEPCAAPTIQEALIKSRKWSYSTVKTMMDRMAAKNLLKTEKLRNLILYRSSITPRQAQKGEVMNTVKRAFNGAMTPMMQFLLDSNDFTADQLGELQALIKIKQKRKNSAGKKSK